MTFSVGCRSKQSQLFTFEPNLELMFASKEYRVQVFDGISHGTAWDILNQVKLINAALSFFGTTVLLPDAIETHFSAFSGAVKIALKYADDELRDDGVPPKLTDTAFSRAREYMGGFKGGDPITTRFFPPRAMLKLCFFLPCSPVTAATIGLLWEYVKSNGLDKSEPLLPEPKFSCLKSSLAKKVSGHDIVSIWQEEAKKREVFGYIHHFGSQQLLSTWKMLFAHKGDFPPTRRELIELKRLAMDGILP